MTRLAATAILLSVLAVVGCEPSQTRQRELKLQTQADAAESKTRQLNNQIAQLNARISDQDEQIQTLSCLGSKRLDVLAQVEKIELGSYTGGIDTDGKPGQDAVKVFLKPYDKDRHILKTTGDVKIEIYDLAQPPENSLYAEYEFSAAELNKHYFQGMMTNHYSFVCPWPNGKPPAHNDLTIRLTFTDYLTGKTLSSQKQITITPPPAGR